MKTISTIIAAICIVMLTSCVTDDQAKMDVNPDPDDDRKYYKSYSQNSRQQKVIINFETRYEVTATYLSPEFRSAFAKRFEGLFNAPQPFLEEASSKAGFFVTIFSPEDEGYNLTDDQLWSIQLRTGGRAFKPIIVKRLNNKDRWTPFFTDVHRWSNEYLVLFDTPSVSMGGQMVDKNELALLLANADAKVQFDW